MPLLMLEHSIRTTYLNVFLMTVASAALFGLVIARLAGVVTRHDRAKQREACLRQAAADLVGTRSRSGIYRIAVDSALALSEAGGVKAKRTTLSLGGPGGMTVVGAAGANIDGLLGRRVDERACPRARPCSRARRLLQRSGRGRRGGSAGRRATHRVPAPDPGRVPGRPLGAHRRPSRSVATAGPADARRTGRPRARERRAHRGSPRAGERATLPPAGAELDRRDRRARARPDDPICNPLGEDDPRVRVGGARRDEPRRPAQARRDGGRDRARRRARRPDPGPRPRASSCRRSLVCGRRASGTTSVRIPR